MTYMKKCLAVLLAVLMCVGVCVFQFASVSAAVSYLPTRYVSMTVENDNDINPLVAFDSSGAFPGTAGTYTVTGYYKIEDLSDFEGRDDGSAVVFGTAVQDNEAGVWLPFEGSFDTACAYRGIYLYYMNGTISMADVVIKNELGDVVYDMATDSNWTDGTAGTSIWATVSFGSNAATRSFVTNEPYAPTRYVSMTVENDNDINPLVAFDSSGAFPGTAGTYTVTGYYKTENLADFEGRDDGSAVVFDNSVADTDGAWAAFEGSFDTACAYRGMYLYYMNGTISMADVVIKNELGDVVYDMATDANWTDGTAGTSIWATVSFGSNAATRSFVTVASEEEEEFKPKRVVTLTTSDEEPCIQVAAIIDFGNSFFASKGESFTVTGKYSFEKGESMDASGKAEIFGMALTESTDGWVDLVDANGDPFVFTSASGWKNIQTWATRGVLKFADLQIINETGDVIYDMATDKDFVADGTYNTSRITNGFWYFWWYNNTTYPSDKAVHIFETNYYPTRTMSITSSGDEVEGKFIINKAGTELGAGKQVTMTGYYKVDDFAPLRDITSDNVDVAGNPITADTAGWVPFSKTFETDDSIWTKLGFWYAQGTLSLADIVITDDSTGDVIYEMAYDEKLVACTDKVLEGPLQYGLWYIGYFTKASDNTVNIDPVVEREEEPEPPHEAVKWFQLNSEGNINPQIKFTLPADEFNAEGTYNWTAYVRMANETEHAGHEAENSFQYNYWVGSAYTAHGDVKDAAQYTKVTGSFEGLTDENGTIDFFLWYTDCAWLLADFTITDPEGNVVYSMATDEDLQLFDGENVLTHGDTVGRWSVVDYAGAPIEVKVLPAYELDAPYVWPELVYPHPEETNRVITINSASGGAAVGMVLNWDDEVLWPLDGDYEKAPYIIYTKVKVSDLELLSEEDYAGAYLDLGFSGDTGYVEMITIQEDTDGYVWLKTELGEWPSFDNNADVDNYEGEDVTIIFGMTDATGSFSIADMRILNADGNIIYSMANDGTLYGNVGVNSGSGRWISEVADPEVDSIVCTTKEEEYVPNRYLLISSTKTVSNPDYNVAININPNNAVFDAEPDTEGFQVGTFYLRGKVKINLVESAGAGTKAYISSKEGSRNLGSTGGWISLTDVNGDLISFKSQETLTDYVHLAIWEGFGNVAIADLEILNEDGEVVYSFADDETFWENGWYKHGEFQWGGHPVFAYGWSTGQAYIQAYTAEDTTEHTADEYGVPVFEEEGLDLGDDEDESSSTPEDESSSTPEDDESSSSTEDESASNPDSGATGTVAMSVGALIVAAAVLMVCCKRKED